jgi:hypothetical protein
MSSLAAEDAAKGKDDTVMRTKMGFLVYMVRD